MALKKITRYGVIIHDCDTIDSGYRRIHMGFTCNERPGRNNVNELIASLMVSFVNEKMGYEALKVKDNIKDKNDDKMQESRRKDG